MLGDVDPERLGFELTATGNGVRSDEEASGDAWVEGDLAAQRSAPEGEPRRGGEVIVQVGSNPPSLNTIVHSDWLASRITKPHIYEALVNVDPYDHPNYRHQPALAERWDISEDNLVYTFHLRRNVTWHDGQPFTSRDVIATYDKIQDEAVRAAHIRSYLEELESYEAIDDFTVRFTWRRPYFLSMDMPFTGVPIQPAHVLTELSGSEYNEAATNPLNRNPIGTGPFKFVEWRNGERIVVDRNDAYWDRPPYLDRVTFRIVLEDPVALRLAERGDIHVLNDIRSEAWRNMDNPFLRENYSRSRFFDANYAWIGWNQTKPFFQDARVRRAMTLLTDRPGFIEQMQYGLPMPTTCHFYFASPACDPDLEPLPFDPEAAIALLEEAGWVDSDGDGVREKDGVRFEFQFMIPASSEGAARMGTKMKEDFARAGVVLNLQRVEWTAFVGRLREHNFDACTLVWGGGARGDPSQIWHSNSIDGGSNYISFRNERADEIIEQARVTLDDEARQELYREFGRILYEEQPYTWLYVRPRLALIHKQVRGVQESLQFWQYRDWWLAESAE